MLKFNSFRAQRYLRSRFIEGKYLLASEASDIELELIDFSRTLVENTLGDIAVDTGWKVELYKISTVVTSKASNVLGVDTSLLDLVNIGDKVFKNGAFVTDITNVNVGGGTITVSSAASINISDTIEIQTTNSLLINPGEGWYKGLPFSMRGGKDQLVSGSTLGAGILVVPGGGSPNMSLQDEPQGRGKILTFSDGGITPSSNYQVVISAREQVVTNTDDPFIKNVNIPESTAQKLRLTYRINVVPVAEQDTKPVPYTDSTVDGNLTNYIEVIPQAAQNGSEISRTVISGSSQAIDGRDLEITIRNNTSGSNPSYSGSPVGNLIPVGASEQAEYANGTFVDSLGQSYHLNAIFNDVVANQVILRLDKEVSQPDPQIIIGQSYKLYKRDVYVTDDTGGAPLGQLFWPVANVVWDSTDGFVHDSKVTDLRNSIESLADHEDKTIVKFNLRLLGGGIVTAEPTVKATATVTVINNTFNAGDSVIVNGASFVYNVDWMAGVDTDASAANLAAAINSSSDPLIANVVTANAVGSVITLTAYVGGTAGNSLTLAESDGATNNFTLSGALFTGGLDGTPGELVWDDDFKIVNPNGVTQLISAGRAVLREGGAAAFLMDLENGGVISLGELSVTTTTNGTSISLSGSPDLSKVSKGNTLVVGQETTSITSVDDVNKTLEVSPALSGTGSAFISLDSFASGTAPLDPNIFVLAVKTGTIIQVTGRGELEQGESTSSGIPIQLLQYIGSSSETDSTPNYISTEAISQGDNLTLAIGKLDGALKDLADYSGAPIGDTAPDYSNEYAVADGDSLTTAIGKLDAEAERVATDLSNRLDQLKLIEHETDDDKVRVTAADILQLDGATLSQELSTLLLDFDGSVIDFTTGEVFETDGSTPLGIDFTPFSIPSGQYFWYGVGAIANTIGSDNRVSIQFQISPAASANAVQANAPYPNIVGSKKIGAVQIFNNSGTLEVADIRRIAPGSGSGGSGSGLIKADLYNPISTTLPTGASPTIDGETLLEDDLVFFTNLSVGNNRIYKATNVAVSVAWQVQRPFENASETPFVGDLIKIKRGSLYEGQTVYLNSSNEYVINDIIRLFDGDKGTDFWELGSIKTVTLLDNTTDGEVFDVNVSGSENWVINYSLVRNSGSAKETGQIYISTNGTVASMVVNNAYISDSGVTFKVDLTAGVLTLQYDTTSTGDDATMKFYTSRWSDSPGGPSGVPNYSGSGSGTPADGATGDVQFKGGSGNLTGDTKFKWNAADQAVDLNGLRVQSLQGPVILTDNQPTDVLAFNIPDTYKWCVVEYSLERDGDTQVGRLLITQNGVVANVSDDFIGTAALGIMFSVDLSGGNIRVLYTSTSTGFNASLKYSVRRW